MEQIVFLERGTLKYAAVRRPCFPHGWREYDATAPIELVERLHEATIAIVNKIPVCETDLSQLPALKLIAVAATGTDNIDLESCRRRSIAVRNVRGYAVRTLPEHVLMLALALRRNLINYRQSVERGAWSRATHFCLLDYPIHDLHASTLGIIGYGALGQAVAQLARAFGMKIVIAERRGIKGAMIREGRTAFDETLRTSDIVTLHAPLTDKTRHLIGASELKLMKSSALLINCGRGGLVDEAALIESLRVGEIAGAGVDVLSSEPPPEGNPLLPEHASWPNLIVTPHVAWASVEAMQALADQLIDNIEEFVSGRET